MPYTVSEQELLSLFRQVGSVLESLLQISHLLLGGFFQKRQIFYTYLMHLSALVAIFFDPTTLLSRHPPPEGSLKISGIESLPERDGSLKRDGTLSLSVATRGTNGDPRITRCGCGRPSHLDCRRLQRRQRAANVGSVTTLLRPRSTVKKEATQDKNDVTCSY